MATKRGGQGFARSDRIAEQMRRELAEILRFEIKDPRLSSLFPLVTITEIEVSADYSHARVFYTSLADSSAADTILDGLTRLSGHLRRELGKRIRLHQIPALHFKFDASVERGTHLSRLIDETIASDSAAQSGREDMPQADGSAVD
jgi:ribosome-binding factor A